MECRAFRRVGANSRVVQASPGRSAGIVRCRRRMRATDVTTLLTTPLGHGLPARRVAVEVGEGRCVRGLRFQLSYEGAERTHL